MSATSSNAGPRRQSSHPLHAPGSGRELALRPHGEKLVQRCRVPRDVVVVPGRGFHVQVHILQHLVAERVGTTVPVRPSKPRFA